MVYIANENRYKNMKYRRVGNSGLVLPIVSLGLWHNFGSVDNYKNMVDMLEAAFDAGINHFDLANNYGPIPGSAETNFGKIINGPLLPYRDELIISTKAGYTMWDGPYGDGGSRKYLIASLNQSLERMNLDYVDIFYHHRMDFDTPLEETMSALASIVASGKALYVGLSNYDGENLEKATKLLNDLNCPFIINQNRYSIFDRTIEENGLKETSEKLNKGIMVFSPLAQGLLTGRYLNGIPEDSRIAKESSPFLNKDALTEDVHKKIVELNKIAENRNQTLAQMALSWVLKDDCITSVLIGASKVEQILENVKIVDSTEFSNVEISEIDKIVNSLK